MLDLVYVQLCIYKGIINICWILGHIFFNHSKHVRINNGAFIPALFSGIVSVFVNYLWSELSHLHGDFCVMTRVFDLFFTVKFSYIKVIVQSLTQMGRSYKKTMEQIVENLIRHVQRSTIQRSLTNVSGIL